MKKTMKTMVSATLSALALMASTPFAHAGDDYVLIRRTDKTIGDDAGSDPKGRFTFSLPTNANPNQVAILQMRVFGARSGFHSIYLDPGGDLGAALPTFGCPVANADQSTLRIDAHPTASQETFLNHFVIDGLSPGTHTLVICPRSDTGLIDDPGNPSDNNVEVDDITVGRIVLHYKTTP